jgi:hypothetical protein
MKYVFCFLIRYGTYGRMSTGILGWAQGDQNGVCRYYAGKLVEQAGHGLAAATTPDTIACNGFFLVYRKIYAN